jgi:hypothetical protein
MNTERTEFYRKLIESAGAIFCGIQQGPDDKELVIFQREKGGSSLALYTTACRDAHDVELALKADRERYAPIVLG